jgi:hypothetical protein
MLQLLGLLAASLLLALRGAPPPEHLPEELLSQYSMGGQVRLHRMYVNENGDGEGTHWSFPRADMAAFVRGARTLLENCRRGRPPRGQASKCWLIEALELHWDELAASSTACVFGSTDPWVESLLLAMDANSSLRIATIDINRLTFEHDRLSTHTLSEWRSLPSAACDFALSISSFDHTGLGRYGEALEPDGSCTDSGTSLLAQVRMGVAGDVTAMNDVRRALEGSATPRRGLLFLTLPIGEDLVVWNALRRYGKLRLPKLLEGMHSCSVTYGSLCSAGGLPAVWCAAGWDVISRHGWDEAKLGEDPDFRRSFEPVHVLRPSQAGSSRDPNGRVHQIVADRELARDSDAVPGGRVDL